MFLITWECHKRTVMSLLQLQTIGVWGSLRIFFTLQVVRLIDARTNLPLWASTSFKTWKLFLDQIFTLESSAQDHTVSPTPQKPLTFFVWAFLSSFLISLVYKWVCKHDFCYLYIPHKNACVTSNPNVLINSSHYSGWCCFFRRWIHNKPPSSKWLTN